MHLLLRKGGTCFPVKMEEIIRFETNNGYTCIYLHKEKFTECGHIGLFEEKVYPSGLFVRVHRSHLINYQHVIAFGLSTGVMVSGGARVPISMQGYLQLLEIFR